MLDTTTASIIILSSLALALVFQEVHDYRKRKRLSEDSKPIDLSGLARKK